MRLMSARLTAAKTAYLIFLGVACSSGTANQPPPSGMGAQGGGTGDTGGAMATGGATATGGSVTGGAPGGATGTGGVTAPDAAPMPSPDAGPSPGTGGVSGGGKALMVLGAIPPVGTDAVVVEALKARGVEVDLVRETMLTPEMAENRRVVVISCSILSTSFKADLTGVKSPIMVLEHHLLENLGMTAAPGHGFQQGLTAITMTSTDPVLAQGLTGDVTVYMRTGEMFWGVPGPGAIKIATAKGAAADRSFYFVYPAGAMMASMPAAGKRLHFFFAVHSPPPVTTLYLNDNGLKLLGGALDWLMK